MVSSMVGPKVVLQAGAPQMLLDGHGQSVAVLGPGLSAEHGRGQEEGQGLGSREGGGQGEAQCRSPEMRKVG